MKKEKYMKKLSVILIVLCLCFVPHRVIAIEEDEMGVNKSSKTTVSFTWDKDHGLIIGEKN